MASYQNWLTKTTNINYFSSRSIFDKRCLLTHSQRSKSETWCYMTFESIPLWTKCSCKTVQTQHQGSSTTFELHIITSRTCSIKFSSKQYTMWLISLSPWWISLCYHFLYANLKNVLYPHYIQWEELMEMFKSFRFDYIWTH